MRGLVVLKALINSLALFNYILDFYLILVKNKYNRNIMMLVLFVHSFVSFNIFFLLPRTISKA